jgi:putative sterol carrier protein
MAGHSRPPEDISPEDFFTRWVPAQVALDSTRRARLGNTRAMIEFELRGEGGGVFSVSVDHGEVRGFPGQAESRDLGVRLDVPTWRELNRGALSAPEAALRRRVHLEGSFLLALKLHLILG